MRSLVAAVFLLAACATMSAPPDQVQGCWIERTARDEAHTMRWFPDPERPGYLVGDYLSYPNTSDARRYTLARVGEGWNFCQAPAAGEQRCWPVASGTSGSLEGGRAFIDVHNDRLRIAILDGRFERVIFNGARDGCD
jgi:hypothetical protein